MRYFRCSELLALFLIPLPDPLGILLFSSQVQLILFLLGPSMTTRQFSMRVLPQTHRLFGYLLALTRQGLLLEQEQILI